MISDSCSQYDEEFSSHMVMTREQPSNRENAQRELARVYNWLVIPYTITNVDFAAYIGFRNSAAIMH